MALSRALAVVCIFAFIPAMPADAQTPTQTDEILDLSQLEGFRDATTDDASLPDELRTQIVQHYESAIASLNKAAANHATAAAFERDRRGVDRIVRRLRAEVEQPELRPKLPLSEHPTVEQAEDALARERARLEANRVTLREQQRVAEDRATLRSDISQRLGELDLEIELLNNELRAQAESAARTELKSAVRQDLLARRETARSEVEMLRTRLVLLNDRSSLIPLETDLAQRRVSLGRELVEMIEERAHELQRERAQELLGETREQSRRLAEELPSLAQLAAETEELAVALWATDGLVARSEQTIKDLDITRRHQAQLSRIADLTSRKFEAYGHRGSVTRWWPDVPDDFPEPGSIAKKIQAVEEEIPEVEHRLIIYEQQRSTALELARTTMLDLQAEYGDELDPALSQHVRDLFGVRQDLLDELVQRGGRYSNLLAEYRTATQRFLDQTRRVERFLYSHILWSRSVPKPIIPRPRDIGEALRVLVSPRHLANLSIVGIEFSGYGLLSAVVLAALVLLRQPMRRRLLELGRRVSDPETDSLKHTIGALLHTLLLAAPLPLAFFMAAELIERIGTSTYWYSSAEALHELVWVAALLELVRQLFAPHGLAEAHFGWPVTATKPLHRGLLLTEAIGLPLLYVALIFAFAGMRLDSPDNLQLFNNSLGRVAFIAALLVFGTSILAMLRPEKKQEPAAQEMHVPWPRRFSNYAFPTAFLGAYPIVILATFLPALLATLGFYVTAVLLAYQMLRTLLLGVVVLIVGGLVHRWRIVHRNRALAESEGALVDKELAAEFEQAEIQVRQLLRFAIVGALAVGLLSIWSDALPMLQLLKRVQLLPRVELLASETDTATTLGITARTTDAVQAVPSSPEAAVEPGAAPSADDAPAATAAADSKPLTLWLLLEAILAAVLTVALVRNLPGVLKIVLQRRTTLDTGARFALITLVRYSLTIIGTIVVFSLLGITWSKVQWLAAALTFGLGFGLQEIVANFVSGLILLVERPVRVGDVVTIGNLMGRVTRIQIRATTITLWDRSEMIVPNKEFITTKLVNWTLSDSKRRIEIPLRIAYGTDLEQVKGILVEIAEEHPSVLEDPPPHVLLLAFGEDAIKYELRFVVDFGQGLTTKDEVQNSIERAFREHGIEFALPKSEVRFVSEGGTASPVESA